MDNPSINARPRIRLDGQMMPNLGEAALGLQIHLPRIGMASAELRLLNWGPDSAGKPDFRFQDIRPGAAIEILLGEDAQSPAFKGEITALEERYGEGAPQIVILAEDALHRLARQRRNKVFESMSLDDVLQQVASDAGLSPDVQVGSATGDWLQANESNLAFLLRLTAPYDVGLRIQDGKLWAKSEQADGDPVRLDAGRNVEKARIVADLNRQPLEVKVAGHDLKAGSDADSSSASLSPAPAGQTATALLEERSWQGSSTPPHPFARSQSEARTLAERQFRQAARNFLHGDIICRDTPTLRAGREVELSGVSPRLSGRYLVVDCRHQFDQTQGLNTRLQVQRADWNA